MQVHIADFDPVCPVCGAINGTCRGNGSTHSAKLIPPKPKDDPSATFTVPERIYETKVGANGRTYKKLIYPKGARIRPQEAKRLGLIP